MDIKHTRKRSDAALQATEWPYQSIQIDELAPHPQLPWFDTQAAGGKQKIEIEIQGSAYRCCWAYGLFTYRTRSPSTGAYEFNFFFSSVKPWRNEQQRQLLHVALLGKIMLLRRSSNSQYQPYRNDPTSIGSSLTMTLNCLSKTSASKRWWDVWPHNNIVSTRTVSERQSYSIHLLVWLNRWQISLTTF